MLVREDNSMAFRNRAFWALLALAPMAVLTESTANAAGPSGAPGVVPLPHGIHLSRSGRYTQDVCDHDAAFYCLAQRLLPPTYRPGDPVPQAGGSAATTPPTGTMAPSDVQAAYSIPAAASAGGKIVAIQDMPYTTALADLNVYRKQYGLAPLAQCAGKPTGTSPCFAVADENGNLNPTLADGGSADTETSLDMDMISAACPDCSILLMEFTSSQGPTDQDFVVAAAAAQTLGAVATSISWGGAESGSDPTGYTQAGKMLVLAASGDSGYLQEGGPQVLPFIGPDRGGGGGGGAGTPGYPASSPDVLAVGGTNLEATGSGAYTEVVWADSSGATTSGCSTEYATPAFQTAFLATHPSAFGTCAKRATNDVSAAAEFTPASGAQSGGGIAEYSSTQGGWGAVVGTSAATPEVAAILTRLGLATQVSSDLGFVYENITAFNDVTSGTNAATASNCTNAVMCTAAAGWDGPTGVGTPNGAKLYVLAGGSSSSSGSSSGGTPDAGPVADSGPSSGGSSSSGSSSGGGSSSSSGASSGSSGSSGAGLPDGGAANSENPTNVGWNPDAQSGCGCSMVDARTNYGAMTLGIGIALGLGLRRRRPRA